VGKLLEPGDELGLPWDDYADGRVYRLAKGADFVCSSLAAREAAENAAERLGKVVRTKVDVFRKKIFVWVQFADNQIEDGEPCPCGSTDMPLVNESLAVCRACGALNVILRSKRDRTPQEERQILPGKGDELLEFLLGIPPGKLEQPSGKGGGAKGKGRAPGKADDGGPAEGKVGGAAQNGKTGSGKKAGRPQRQRLQLGDFSGVELFESTSSDKAETFFGYGLDKEGRRMLLLVEYPLRDGRRVEDSEVETGFVHEVRAIDADPFAEAIDFDALRARMVPVETD
jgi:hypothetical protein